ncbi:MAG: transcriptional regulator [Planctomycetia bacterium]|nr:transcriptional regulator [Planctomycetia bacterium]
MTQRATDTIASTLRQSIRASGIPLMWLARETQVSRTRIGHFVNGTAGLSLKNADKLAAFFRLQLVRPASSGQAPRRKQKRKRRIISDALRESIRASAIPVVWIARETGVSRGRIIDFMSGKRSPQLGTAQKLARFARLHLAGARARKGRRRRRKAVKLTGRPNALQDLRARNSLRKLKS